MAFILISLSLIVLLLLTQLIQKDQEVEHLKARYVARDRGARQEYNDLECERYALKCDLKASLTAGDGAVMIAEKHEVARKRLLQKLKDSRSFGKEALDSVKALDILIEKERAEQSNKLSISQQQKCALEEVLAKVRRDLDASQAETSEAEDRARAANARADIAVENYNELREKYQTLHRKIQQLNQLFSD